MDEAMIAKWNAVVKPEDEVYHLGDVAFCCSMEYAIGIMNRLTGIKHLIVGNHDKLALGMNNICPNIWASIKDMSEVTVDGQHIVLCHYPLRTWHHSYRGVWHLFGHVHGTLDTWGKSLDIGVDCWNFAPVSFENLKARMDTLPNTHAIKEHEKWDKSNQETE